MTISSVDFMSLSYLWLHSTTTPFWNFVEISEIGGDSDSVHWVTDSCPVHVVPCWSKEHLLEPMANEESCVLEVNGFVFDINSLRLESGLVQNCRRSMDNKSAISWEVGW